MSNNIALAYFDHEQDVLHATAELRARGVEVLDVYSPHAIHGMDEALGLRPSRLTWVCFLCGAFGVLGALWFQHWANAVDWPIDVGGKPWNSLPAEAPVAYDPVGGGQHMTVADENQEPTVYASADHACPRYGAYLEFVWLSHGRGRTDA